MFCFVFAAGFDHLSLCSKTLLQTYLSLVLLFLLCFDEIFPPLRMGLWMGSSFLLLFILWYDALLLPPPPLIDVFFTFFAHHHHHHHLLYLMVFNSLFVGWFVVVVVVFFGFVFWKNSLLFGLCEASLQLFWVHVHEPTCWCWFWVCLFFSFLVSVKGSLQVFRLFVGVVDLSRLATNFLPWFSETCCRCRFAGLIHVTTMRSLEMNGQHETHPPPTKS